MKKICAYLLLCVFLAAAPSALAETAADQELSFNTYSNEVFGYQIDYPSEWILLNDDTIDYVIQQLSSGEVVIEGFTPSALDTVRAMLSASDTTGFVQFMDWYGNNFNVSCFSYPTPPSMQDALEVVAPQVIDSYKMALTNLTVLDSGSVYGAGGSDYLKIKCHYVISNRPITVTTLLYFKSGMVYNICFTWMVPDADVVQTLDQILDTVVASFVSGP